MLARMELIFFHGKIVFYYTEVRQGVVGEEKLDALLYIVKKPQHACWDLLLSI